MRTIKGPAIKHPDDGAREGAAFVREHIIRVQERAFDASMQGRGHRPRPQPRYPGTELVRRESRALTILG